MWVGGISGSVSRLHIYSTWASNLEIYLHLLFLTWIKWTKFTLFALSSNAASQKMNKTPGKKWLSFLQCVKRVRTCEAMFANAMWNWRSEFVGKLICQLCEFMEYWGPGRIRQWPNLDSEFWDSQIQSPACIGCMCTRVKSQKSTQHKCHGSRRKQTILVRTGKQHSEYAGIHKPHVNTKCE